MQNAKNSWLRIPKTKKPPDARQNIYLDLFSFGEQAKRYLSVGARVGPTRLLGVPVPGKQELSVPDAVLYH